MAGPRKSYDNNSGLEQVGTVAVADVPVYGDVKQLVRRIYKAPVTTAEAKQQGYDSVFEVDAQLDVWSKQGYALFNTHFLGNTPESYDILYILVKRL